jgi:CRISPR/Cas system-associated protein Cas10 (large subunit of type III CRISPR-Cas system)
VQPSAPAAEEPTREVETTRPPPAEEERNCVVCLDAQRTHACLPCGHKVLCESCSNFILGSTCPICRKKVEYVAKIYD